MNSISGLAWLVIFDCACCCAQTNDCTGTPVRYFLPPLQLRTEAPAETKESQNAPSSPGSNSPMAKVAADVKRRDESSTIHGEGSRPLTSSATADFVTPAPVTSGDSFELDNSAAPGEFHSRVIRSGEFYLTRPESKSDSGVVRFVEGIFTPEIIRVGKTSVSCSVITAVKRKNPLCLLNPLVFQASW
jgi:hypothetical protein